MRFDDVLLEPAWPASQRLSQRALAAALILGRYLSPLTLAGAAPRALAKFVDADRAP